MVEENSVEAYKEINDDGSLGERQLEVLKYIREHPNCTYNEICRSLGLHHNTCTARIRELRTIGAIVKSGDVRDGYTHKMNSTYRVRQPGEPEDKPKEHYTYIPRMVKNTLVDMLEGDYKESTYDYSDNTGTYHLERKNGVVSMELVGRYYFEDIGLYAELNSQEIFWIYGLDFNFAFKTK